MSLTRRSFLTTSAGVAAGAAALAAPGVAGARRSTAGSDSTTTEDAATSSLDTSAAAGAVLYIRDAGAGDVVIMRGEGEIVVNDPSLVAAVAKATASGKG